MFHIVDVDNTLVFTNQLNTAGYVYALSQMGLELSTTIPDRITRDGIQSLQAKNWVVLHPISKPMYGPIWNKPRLILQWLTC